MGKILLLSGTFEQMVISCGVILTIFTGLAVDPVMVVRNRNPQLPRPFKVSLYPFVPALYIMVCIMVVIYTGMERPTESTWEMVTILTGIPLYFLLRPAIGDHLTA